MTQLTGVSALSTPAGFTFEELPEATGIAPERIFFPVQTHSAEVRLAMPGADLQGVDGLVCTRPGVLIGVRTADCLPLLLADIDAGVIAAVHCGWRGTVGGIVANALRLMTDCGADPARIHAAMGPCICPACFEVGEEVATLFDPRAVERRAGAKPRVSLPRAVELQLRASGVRDITPPPACSMHSTTFYSVRRQGRTLPHRTLTALALTPAR